MGDTAEGFPSGNVRFRKAKENKGLPDAEIAENGRYGWKPAKSRMTVQAGVWLKRKNNLSPLGHLQNRDDFPSGGAVAHLR